MQKNASYFPEGVNLISLKMHHDERGMFSELYRKEWNIGIDTLQWNIAHSQPNVLRGVHLHWNHIDYLIVIKGHMTLCLQDVRESSLTKGKSYRIELKENELQGIVIPTGIAHGFYFNEPSTHIYSVSDYWNLSDELGCKWNSSELNMDWPCNNPMLSHRDSHASTYNAMIQEYLQRSSENVVTA